ncbi:MAG TPA: hypothetical protein VIJ75_09850 [Hanamia sp.]
MKSFRTVNVFLLFFFLLSCGRNTHGENQNVDTSIIIKSESLERFQTGKIINSVVCNANAQQSYALYIPSNTNNDALPVIYFFDPHGDGVLPLEKYKALAETYHFILIGSNNSKNGNDWNDAENIWNTMSNDSQGRIHVNKNRVYTCGFSGGAKVATFIALQHHEIKGVIANGAGLPDILNAGNFNFSFTAISGRGDMNMTDLISINNSLDKTNTTHRILFFDGIHEWAPESMMNTAFSAIQTDAMRQKLIPRDEPFINNIIDKNKNKVDSNISEDQLLEASETCNFSISILAGLTKQVNWFRMKNDSLANNPNYQKQWLAHQKILSQEETIKAGYQQQFGNNDIDYWNKIITGVKAKASEKTPEGAMYQRLQAYLSLAFYSISNQFITSNENKEARHFVTLYKLADSSNSEAWYFSAILDARNNDTKAVKKDLLQAVSLGFNDKKRLEDQPEFKLPHIQIELMEIESKMKS